MFRIFSLALLFVALTGILSAAEQSSPNKVGTPQYQMCLMNLVGQISLPDESGRGLAKKTYFLDLDVLIRSESALYFGGSGQRFKALKYDAGLKVLTCEEVATKKIFKLEMGKWINFHELPP